MILGFDPGLGDAMPGGWCLLEDGKVYLAESMPAAGKIVDVPYVVRTVLGSCVGPDLVVVERQHGRPQDGVRSLNVCLPAYGQLLGMCQAMRWPLKIVDPKDWKNVILRGTMRDKAAACAYVATRHPTVDLRPGRRRKPHDGIADAVCITEWGWRFFQGENNA